MKAVILLLLSVLSGCDANPCGSLLRSSSVTTPNGWYMCYTTRQDGTSHTDCKDLIKNVVTGRSQAAWINSSRLLAGGGNFGCFRTRGGIQSVDVSRACRDFFQHDTSMATNCPDCDVLGVCVRRASNYNSRPATLFSCGFSSGWCGMRQSTSDHQQWTRKNGATSSTGTGPTTNSFYIFYETSSPVGTGDLAVVETPVLTSSSVAVCLRFNLHMYGAAMGDLDVFAGRSYNYRHTRLFTRSGNYNDTWHQISTGTTLRPGDRIIFRGTRGTDYTSDMAIDDITVTTGGCNHLDTNECSDSPCVNGGRCVDSLDTYVCECNGTNDHMGRNCQIPVTSVAEVNCDARAMYIKVNTSLFDLLLQGADPTTLYLGNTSCTGRSNVSGGSVDWVVQLDDCLTQRQESQSYITYSNTLTTGFSNTTDVITSPPWAMTLECRLQRYRHLASQLIPTYQDTGHVKTVDGKITIQATVYTNRTSTLSSFPTKINMDEKVYVNIHLQRADDDLLLGLYGVYGTPTNATTSSSDKHDLIHNNCPVNDAASVHQSVPHSLSFSFNMFKFPNQDSVFVHTLVALCVHNSSHTNTSLTCDRRTTCHGRVRTRRDLTDMPASVYELSIGPFLVDTAQNHDPIAPPQGFSIQLGIGIVCGLVFGAFVGAFLAVLVKRRHGNREHGLGDGLTRIRQPTPAAESTYTDGGAVGGREEVMEMKEIDQEEGVYMELDI